MLLTEPIRLSTSTSMAAVAAARPFVRLPHSARTFAATSSRCSQSPQSPPPPEIDPRPSRSPGGSHEKHRLFYREFYPPLFRCFAYGTGVYFALHLAWQYLDSAEQDFLRSEERSTLESLVKDARAGASDLEEKADKAAGKAKESVKDAVDGGAQAAEGKKKRSSWWSRS